MDIDPTIALMQDFYDNPPFKNPVSSFLRKKTRVMPGIVIHFLSMFPLMSDNWWFKQAPGGIFGPMFTSINEVSFFFWALSSLVVPHAGA